MEYQVKDAYSLKKAISLATAEDTITFRSGEYDINTPVVAEIIVRGDADLYAPVVVLRKVTLKDTARFCGSAETVCTYDDSLFVVYDECRVEARDRSIIEVRGRSTVELYDDAKCYAYGGATITMHEGTPTVYSEEVE